MDRIRRVVLVVLALILTLMLRPDWGSEGTALAIGFSVNSTLDTSDGCPGDGFCATGTCLVPLGTCTLRAAIEEANATPGPHTISFTIAGTIQPLFQLPAITQPFVTIDGPTPPGDIVLDGSNAGLGANGLVIQTYNTTVRGLVIHGFQVTNAAGNDFSQGNGIVIQMGTNNTIEDNFIGTNEDGNACVGNGGSGVLIGGPDSIGAANNNTVRDNLITCNGFQDQTVTGWDGVTIWSALTNVADNNQVLGNYIGVDVTGTTTLTVGTDTFGFQHVGNTGNGVRIAGGDSNTVGGTSAGARNIISGNELAGVRIEGVSSLAGGANNNEVLGNHIGMDVNGTSDLGNLDVGVYVVGLLDDADGNQIGGTTGTTPGGPCTGACNLISGNGAAGVSLLGGNADSNTVQGNFIGTDLNGTAAIPNDGNGITITDAENNDIGGTATAARNLVSGNGGIGVSIINSDQSGDARDNVVQGNYIGTKANGTEALPNTLSGVVITDAADNDVGGTASGAGNLISGNDKYGVIIMEAGGVSPGATGNKVQGNFIGTGKAGATAVPNQGAGVLITKASSNTVGGATTAAGNLISGNVLQGVRFIEAYTNTVRANLIGTQADGTSPLGNSSHGVVIADSDDNIIGVDGVVPQDNTIAHNGGDGVFVFSGTGNQILSNSIFDNAELGIDLGNDNAVTPNDDTDPDAGANNLQNFPVLTNASISGGPSTDIQGVLNSTPSTQFSVQFFASTACDPSDFGEGRAYLATDTTTTDGSGNATASVTVAGDLTGQFITATATDPDGNTSEFSNCIPVPAAPAFSIDKVVQDLNGGAAEPGDVLRYTINYTNTGNAPAIGVFITDDYSVFCATITNITDGDFPDHDDNGARIRWPASGGILLDAQASGSLSYRCTLDASFPPGPTDVINTSTIDSDQTDPQEDTETVSVTAGPVLTIDKNVHNLNGSFTQPGDTLRYTIHYANAGNAPATGVFIADDYSDLCASISNVTTDANFLNFSDSGGVLRWPSGTTTLAAQASGSVSYDCTLEDPFPPGTADVVNTSTIDSDQTDPQADTVVLSIACFDHDGDHVIGLGDLVEVRARWRLTAANPDPDNDPTTPNYEHRFDSDGDGIITVRDILAVGDMLGAAQTCP